MPYYDYTHKSIILMLKLWKGTQSLSNNQEKKFIEYLKASMHKIYLTNACSIDMKNLMSSGKYKYFKFGLKIDWFGESDMNFAIKLLEEHYSKEDLIIDSIELFKRPDFNFLRAKDRTSEELNKLDNNVKKIIKLLNLEATPFIFNSEVEPNITYYLLPPIFQITHHAIVWEKSVFVWEEFDYNNEIFTMDKSRILRHISEQFKSSIVQDLIPFCTKYVEKDHTFSDIQKSHIKQIVITVMRHAFKNYWSKNTKMIYEYMKSQLSFVEEFSFILHSINPVTIDWLSLISRIREERGIDVCFNFNNNTEDHIILKANKAKVFITWETNDLNAEQHMKDSATRKIWGSLEDMAIELNSEKVLINHTSYFDRVSINWSKSECIISEDNTLWIIRNPISIKGIARLSSDMLESIQLKDEWSSKGAGNSWVIIIKIEDIFSGDFNHPLDKVELKEGENFDTANFEKLISLIPCNSSLYLNWSNTEKYIDILENLSPNIKLSITIPIPFEITSNGTNEETKEKYDSKLIQILSSKSLKKLEIIHRNEYATYLILKFNWLLA